LFIGEFALQRHERALGAIACRCFFIVALAKKLPA